MHALVVEDHPLNRQVMLALLGKYAECDVATNGIEAVQAYRTALAAEKPYDLICMDIMMPQMDGREALAEIRKIEREQGRTGDKAVKIIMTTAIDSTGSVMDAFQSGCEGYLVKPIVKADLTGMLESLGLIAAEQSCPS